MGSATASWLLLLAAEASDLTLPYGEASRPRLCAPSTAAARGEPALGARSASPWDRVRQQPVEQLCLTLARAQIRLARDPSGALASARQLARDWPGRPEPRVLEARALLALGDAAASFAAWQTARGATGELPHEPGAESTATPGASNASSSNTGSSQTSAPSAVVSGALSAHALRDYAVAAALSGHPDVAADTYRRLVSLLDAWPDPRHVQRLYLEAASASLRRTPPAFDEAVGYLSAVEARAHSTGLRAYAAGLHALLRARRGNPGGEPTWLDAPEVWHLVALARAEHPPSHWPRVPRHEVYAIASILVERYSASEAAELWDLYLQGLDGSDPSLQSFALSRKARLAREVSAP